MIQPILLLDEKHHPSPLFQNFIFSHIHSGILHRTIFDFFNIIPQQAQLYSVSKQCMSTISSRFHNAYSLQLCSQRLLGTQHHITITTQYNTAHNYLCILQTIKYLYVSRDIIHQLTYTCTRAPYGPRASHTKWVINSTQYLYFSFLQCAVKYVNAPTV